MIAPRIIVQRESWLVLTVQVSRGKVAWKDTHSAQAPRRRVLLHRYHGNLTSSTSLFVLKRIIVAPHPMLLLLISNKTGKEMYQWYLKFRIHTKV